MARTSVTSFDKDISMETKQDEELLWRGVPKKASYVLSKSVQMLPFAALWLCFDGFIISTLFRADIPKTMIIFFVFFFALHLMPVWIWIHSIISALRKHKSIEYAFTSKRIIVRDGGVLKSHYYKDFSDVSVKVGFVDKLFRVGDITLRGSHYVLLLDIDNPYAVGNKLQQFIEDHAAERKKYAGGIEYEEYRESDSSPAFSKFNADTYDEGKLEANSSSGRFTSKRKADEHDIGKDESEFLESLLNSMDQKDDADKR